MTSANYVVPDVNVRNRSAWKTNSDINSVFSFSVQLYSLKQIINVLLQTENILEKVLRNHVPLTLKKGVMKTGGIVKQTFFVKNLHGENVILFTV